MQTVLLLRLLAECHPPIPEGPTLRVHPGVRRLPVSGPRASSEAGLSRAHPLRPATCPRGRWPVLSVLPFLPLDPVGQERFPSEITFGRFSTNLFFYSLQIGSFDPNSLVYFNIKPFVSVRLVIFTGQTAFPTGLPFLPRQLLP